MLSLIYYLDSSNKLSVFHVAKVQIPPTLTLLDSQSTPNLFKNVDLLTGIKTMVKQDNIYTYVGMMSTRQVGHHPLFKLFIKKLPICTIGTPWSP